jgi:hypothetical protein
MKIDLDYNIETMRITDPGEDESASSGFKKPNIYESIKAQSRVTAADSADQETGEVGRITADVQSAKLKQLLGQIKS